MLSTPSLPLLPSALWPGVVAPDRILSMGQIVWYLNCVQKNNKEIELLEIELFDPLTVYNQMTNWIVSDT